MARKTDIGLERNSMGQDVEASSIVWNGNGGLSIQSSIVRTGSFAAKDVPSGLGDYFWVQNSTQHSQYPRMYFYMSSYPPSTVDILSLTDQGQTTGIGIIGVNSTGQLILYYNNAGTPTQIGSPTSALALNAWNCIELHVDDTGGAGSTIVEGRLNQSVFATRTGAVSLGTGGIPSGWAAFGNLNFSPVASGTFYYDDISINDSSGANQNSYPGAGALTLMLPNAAGDSNTFSVAVGGTAGAANNFTRVDETPPDDATSYNGSATLNQLDLFKCNDPAIGTDTVNCVHVLARMSQSVTNTTIQAQLQAEKAAAGTKATGPAFNPNDTGWFLTNNAHDLVMYTDPDGAAWTEATLATTQIGYKLTTASGTVQIRTSNIWAYVDHIPAVGVTPTSGGNLSLLGVG